MGFKCGIIGLPNVGKSTIFNALTQAQVAAHNYPFCTIEPNVGIVHVPDSRILELAKIVNPEKIIPNVMEFVDIAGIVKGASKGEGLGNKFLAHIREVDAIAHVVRCFTASDVVHVEGKIDPASDIEVINTELILADLGTVEKAVDKGQKASKSGDKLAISEHDILTRLKAHLNKGELARTFLNANNSDDNVSNCIKHLHLLTAKPILYVANVDESGFSNNEYLNKVQAIADKEGAMVVPICASVEQEISLLSDKDKADFLSGFGLAEPGLDRFIRAGYQLLGLKTFFTAGVKEIRAWTIQQGTSAPKAAGVIHSDFEVGFICAEVISYDDFVQYRGEQGSKEAGKMRLEGKTYIVNDGDVMHFRFNV